MHTHTLNRIASHRIVSVYYNVSFYSNECIAVSFPTLTLSSTRSLFHSMSYWFFVKHSKSNLTEPDLIFMCHLNAWISCSHYLFNLLRAVVVKREKKTRERDFNQTECKTSHQSPFAEPCAHTHTHTKEFLIDQNIRNFLILIKKKAVTSK